MIKKVGLVIAVLLLASPATAGGPQHVTLRVEQPAFAGLPVWLVVDADDPCIAIHYQGGPSGQVSAGTAELIGPGGAIVPVGFNAVGYPNGGGRNVQPGDCPYAQPPFIASTNHLPLHLIADLRQPGEYKIRWHVPKTSALGALPPTDWLAFTVQPSTPRQREAWLQDQLAHPPSEPAVVALTYIPALLAAWDDPRVPRRLLEFLCASDWRVSRPAGAAFGPALSEDELLYLTHLVERGCLSDALFSYVNRGMRSDGMMFSRGMHMVGPMPEQQRQRLLHAVTVALPNAHGIDLAQAIHLLAELKDGKNVLLEDGADRAVLHASAAIIAGHDKSKTSSSDQPKWMLVEYFGNGSKNPMATGVLHALATADDPAAGYAIKKLIYRGDPADIPFLRHRLLGPLQGTGLMQHSGFPDDRDDLEEITARFGSQGITLLHTLLGATSPRLRAYSAVQLAKTGDRDAMAAIVAALRSNQPSGQLELINLLHDTSNCPENDDDCYRWVGSTADLAAPWVTARKVKLIADFERRLKSAN